MFNSSYGSGHMDGMKQGREEVLKGSCTTHSENNRTKITTTHAEPKIQQVSQLDTYPTVPVNPYHQ